MDYQSLPLLPSVESGQAGQRILSLFQFIAGAAQVGQTAAVLRLELDGGQAEVPHAAGGVFLGQGVQGVGPVVPYLIGIGGEAPVRVPNEPGQVAAPDPGPVVGVKQHPAGVRFHLIGGVLGVQGKDLIFLVEYDHRDTPRIKVFRSDCTGFFAGKQGHT